MTKKPYHPSKSSHPKKGGKPSYPKRAPREKINKPDTNQADGLLFGVHAVRAALQNPKRVITKIYATENAMKHIEDDLTQSHPRPTILQRRDIDTLVPSGAVHQGLVVQADDLAEVFLSDVVVQAALKDRMTIVILDQVTDPHNIGAIMRSMSAFGATHVVVHKRNTPPITGTLAKTATGAVEHIPIIRVGNITEAIMELKDAGFTCIGMDEHSEYQFGAYTAPDKAALILGAEGSGMRHKTREHCDILVTLPTHGPIRSLNVSVAAAIALFSLHNG